MRVQICTVSDTLRRQSSHLHRYDLPNAAYLVLGADRCGVSSVRACVSVCVLLCTVCLASGTAYAAACAVQSVRVRWGLGSPPLGHMERAWGRAVDASRRKNSKKAFFSVPLANTHPILTKRNVCHCASLQKFRKIQKDPFRSLDCAIIS